LLTSGATTSGATSVLSHHRLGCSNFLLGSSIVVGLLFVLGLLTSGATTSGAASNSLLHNWFGRSNFLVVLRLLTSGATTSGATSGLPHHRLRCSNFLLGCSIAVGLLFVLSLLASGATTSGAAGAHRNGSWFDVVERLDFRGIVTVGCRCLGNLAGRLDFQRDIGMLDFDVLRLDALVLNVLLLDGPRLDGLLLILLHKIIYSFHASQRRHRRLATLSCRNNRRVHQESIKLIGMCGRETDATATRDVELEARRGASVQSRANLFGHHFGSGGGGLLA